MKRLLLTMFLLTTNIAYTEQAITHDSLIGVWAYFHVIRDSFATNKLVGSEQRLLFQDKEKVVLQVIATDQDYQQDTSYNLQYSLSLRDNVLYLSLFSPESKQVLGAYIRMPYKNSLELSSDPNFFHQKQLYQRKDMPLSTPTISSQGSLDSSNEEFIEK